MSTPFASYLQHRLTERDWTIHQLAAASDIPAIDLTELLDGTAAPGLEHLGCLAQAFEDTFATWVRACGLDVPTDDLGNVQDEIMALLKTAPEMLDVAAAYPDAADAFRHLSDLDAETVRAMRIYLASLRRSM